MNFKEFIQSVYKLNEMYSDNSAILRVKMYALVHTYHKDIIGKVIFIDSDNVNDVVKECLPLQTPVVITNMYPSFRYAMPCGTRLKCAAIRIRYKHLCVNYAHDDKMELRVSSMSVTSGETKDIPILAVCEDLISYIKSNVITPEEAEERANVKYGNFLNYLYLEVK